MTWRWWRQWFASLVTLDVPEPESVMIPSYESNVELPSEQRCSFRLGAMIRCELALNHVGSHVARSEYGDAPYTWNTPPQSSCSSRKRIDIHVLVFELPENHDGDHLNGTVVWPHAVPSTRRPAWLRREDRALFDDLESEASPPSVPDTRKIIL